MHATMSVDDVLRSLHSRRSGLTEVEVTELRAQWGWNELPVKRKSLFLAFLRQFRNVLVYILLAALVFSLVMPFFEGETPSWEGFIDAGVILAILLLNAVLGFLQEYKAEEAIALLRKLTAPHARVRRNGTELIIPSRELIPGDIVFVEAGDRISADGRIVEESHLEVNESSLTGESLPAEKTAEALHGEPSLAEQRSMLFSGTLVTRGSAEYVVTDTGMHSFIGRIARAVSETEIPTTPLQQRLARLSAILGVVVLVLCLVLVAIGLYHGFSLADVLLLAVSLAVAAVPEGLPAVVTVCLALGVRRMVKVNVLVRRLESLETLGSVTVICSDKTGTITQNHMTVVSAWVESDGDEEERTDLLALAGASCNRAQLPDLGDPTELGLLEYAERRGVERLPIDEEEVPFTSEEKYMVTRHGKRAFYKGAPEKILTLAHAQDRAAILARASSMAGTGLRVLACAVREGQGTPEFLGLIAMEDPPREGVKAAIQEATDAGIRTIMITGDSIDTAQAIARKVGIQGNAMEGKEIDRLSIDELARSLKTTSVFARVSPFHKVAILEALKKQGEIVAMSGDGVNDASALKGAHVGVAMGRIGTEVARDAASIVLTDDNYVTIIAAVREGRHIYDNIRKFVLYLLQANLGELFLIMITTVVGLPPPLLPLQILWINLLTDSLPALALSMEPAERDIMRRPPRSPAEHLLSGEGGRLLLTALWASCFAFVYFLWQLDRGLPLEEARTATFMLVILFELCLVFNVRSRLPFWKYGFLANPWLLGAIAVPIALQILLVATPLRAIFDVTILSARSWLEIGLIALLGFLAFELLKLIPHSLTGRPPRVATKK